MPYDGNDDQLWGKQRALAGFFSTLGIPGSEDFARAATYGGLDPNQLAGRYLPASEKESLDFLAHMAGPHAQESAAAYGADASMMNAMNSRAAAENTARIQGRAALDVQGAKNASYSQAMQQKNLLDYWARLAAAQAKMYGNKPVPGGTGTPDIVKIQIAQKIMKQEPDPVKQMAIFHRIFGIGSPPATQQNNGQQAIDMLMGITHGMGASPSPSSYPWG